MENTFNSSAEMDINCIVALQIPATGFKPRHCFIREICGWRNSACSNYSDLIRIREVTWMKPGGTCTKGTGPLDGHAGQARTHLLHRHEHFSLLNGDFLCSWRTLTPAYCSAFSASVGTPSPARPPPPAACLNGRRGGIHFNLINNLVDRITQFSSSASFVWSD